MSETRKVVINAEFGGFGLSEAAYERLIEWGIPVRPYIQQKRGEERFWGRVRKTESCWLWTGTTRPGGYGTLRRGRDHGRKEVGAHRLSWEIHNGPISNGLHVCHHCDVPNCVNPAHLFLGTDRDNALDRDRKGRCRAGQYLGTRTHCKRGHEFGPENTRWVRCSSAAQTLKRVCRICVRENDRAAWKRRAGK